MNNDKGAAMNTCEDCPRAATTIVTIHDSAAPTTEFVWHDKPLCDGHRDELVEQIKCEDEDVLGLTIDGMVSLVDGETYLPACERVS